MSKNYHSSNPKTRKKSLDLRARLPLNSDRKQNPLEESVISRFNSDKKGFNSFIEFQNESPSPVPNPEAKQILQSWLKNEQEAFEIKEKYDKNSTVGREKTFTFGAKREGTNGSFKNGVGNVKRSLTAKSNNSSFLIDNTAGISITNRSSREIKEKTPHNISFDFKDGKNELITKVYSIQSKPKPIATLTNKSDRKMDEITKLKNKRKDLEKQTQRMEREMQKLHEKIGPKGQKPREMDSTLENLKQEHDKSKRAYQNFRAEKFFEKVNRFHLQTLKKSGNQAFLLLKSKFRLEKERISKFELKKSVKILKNCFVLWREMLIQEREEQKRKEKLKEDLREEYLQVRKPTKALIFTRKSKKRADKHYRKAMLSRFLRLLKQVIQNSRNLRKPKKNLYSGKNPEIKSKVNNFLSEMKKKTSKPAANQETVSVACNTEVPKVLVQTSIEIDPFNQSFGINDRSQTLTVNIEERFEDCDRKRDRYSEREGSSREEETFEDQIITTIPKPITIDLLRDSDPSKLNNSEDLIKSPLEIPRVRKNSASPLPSKSMEKPSTQQKGTPQSVKSAHRRNLSSQKEPVNQRTLANSNANVPSSAKLKDIEQRAKKRKENQNIIKQKHKENKIQKGMDKRLEEEKKLEDEKQKERDHKQKVLQRKREDALKKETQEQAREREQKNLEKSIRHHKKAQKKYYVLYPLRKAMKVLKEREKLAASFYASHLKRVCFEALNEGITLLRIEQNVQVSKNLERAKGHYERGLKTKVINGIIRNFVDCFEEAERYASKRKGYLQRVCFNGWYKLLPRLREKKLIIEGKYQRIVEQFRFVILADRAMRAWKGFCAEEKKEKVKKTQKDQMWKKVNGWLNEYSEQKKQFKHK